MAHSVFVSYSHKDKPVADAVVAAFEQMRIRCWIAPRDLIPGSTWGDGIWDAIEESRVMVLILSKNSNASKQVLREVELAVSKDVIIIPFRIDNTDPTGAMGYYLSTEHWLDAISPPLQKHIDKLGHTVQLFLSNNEQSEFIIEDIKEKKDIDLGPEEAAQSIPSKGLLSPVSSPDSNFKKRASEKLDGDQEDKYSVEFQPSGPKPDFKPEKYTLHKTSKRKKLVKWVSWSVGIIIISGILLILIKITINGMSSTNAISKTPTTETLDTIEIVQEIQETTSNEAQPTQTDTPIHKASETPVVLQETNEEITQTMISSDKEPINPENADRLQQFDVLSLNNQDGIAWSPDGNQLAVASSQSIFLYQSYNLDEFQSIETPTWIYSLAFSPDGRILAAACSDTTIRLWDPSTGELLDTLEGHSGDVRSLAFSPNGNILASGSWDDTIRLWNPLTGELLNTLEGHTSWVHCVAFSPDGNILASGSQDSTVRLWDVTTGALLNTLEKHSLSVYSVAFSPDGSTLASGSRDKTICLWNVLTGALLDTLQGQNSKVMSNTFSPNGKILASGDGDGTIRLWETKTNELVKTLKGHPFGVNNLSFSPDGTKLASGSWEGTIILWGFLGGN